MKNLCDVLRRTENLSLDDFPELVTLDSRDCADISVVESVEKLDKLGKEQKGNFKGKEKDRSSLKQFEPVRLIERRITKPWRRYERVLKQRSSILSTHAVRVW